MKDHEKSDLIGFLVSAAFCYTASRRPGALIEKLPKELRDKLMELTSDDFRKMRFI